MLEEGPDRLPQAALGAYAAMARAHGPMLRIEETSTGEDGSSDS